MENREQLLKDWFLCFPDIEWIGTVQGHPMVGTKGVTTTDTNERVYHVFSCVPGKMSEKPCVVATASDRDTAVSMLVDALEEAMN